MLDEGVVAQASGHRPLHDHGSCLAIPLGGNHAVPRSHRRSERVNGKRFSPWCCERACVTCTNRKRTPSLANSTRRRRGSSYPAPRHKNDSQSPPSPVLTGEHRYARRVMAESAAPVDQGSTSSDTIDIREVRLQPQNIWRVGQVVIALLAITHAELRHRRWWLGHLHSPDGMVCVDRDGARAVKRLGEPHAPWIRHDHRLVCRRCLFVIFFVVFGRLFIDQIAQLIAALPGPRGQCSEVGQWRLSTKRTRHNRSSNSSTSPQKRFPGMPNNSLVASSASSPRSSVGCSASSRSGCSRSTCRRTDRASDSGWHPVHPSPGACSSTSGTSRRARPAVTSRPVSCSRHSMNKHSDCLPHHRNAGMVGLGIWTGLVAQFVPTIGTYIYDHPAVLVGLLSPNPWIGVSAGLGILYQQVENLTFEPRISAKAVDVHPAVAFGSVLLGAALFGVAGPSWRFRSRRVVDSAGHLSKALRPHSIPCCRTECSQGAHNDFSEEDNKKNDKFDAWDA